MRAGLARVWVLCAATGAACWLRSAAVAKAWLVAKASVAGVWLMAEALVAEAWSMDVWAVRVVQVGWPCRRCSMSLLRDDSMRRQDVAHLGLAGREVGTMELLGRVHLLVS